MDSPVVPVLKVNTQFMVGLAILALIGEIVAPIPPCSPFRFVNEVVESRELKWLFRDLPSHPTAKKCPYPNKFQAPIEEQSLLAYLIKDPNRITKEIRDETTWFAEKGLGRINRRFWHMWDRATGQRTSTF